jgi:Tol biopolymer transport system component
MYYSCAAKLQKIRYVVAVLIASCALFISAPALAIDDPALDYYTITTPHFYVHYFSGKEALAHRAAQIAEEAHVTLSPLLDWTPAGRTHMVVTDKLDTANGSAGVYGRNTITLYGMPPESDSVLGYYDDWLRILVYHEYVHILHLDTVGGVAPILNLLVGKQLNPNQTMPRWFIEGLAVHYESARTATGRVHSSLFQMWLRTAALGDELFTLGQVTGTPTRWPFGSAAYLYGAFFMDWLALRYGEEALTRFNHIYGSRLIPYSMNQAMKQVVGYTFDALWRVWTTEVMAQAAAVRTAVRAAGETQLELVTPRSGDHKFPRIRPVTGEVSWYDWDYQQHPSYKAQTAGGEDTHKLFQIDGAMGPSDWTPDGHQLIFSRTHIVKNVYAYQELEVWDSRTDTRRQLTHMERAREPALSPDGEQVAYVRVVDGSMELVVRPLAKGRAPGAAKVLVSGQGYTWDDDRRWQQLATPTWTPDGRGIVFSWWRMDRRQRDLWLYKLDGPEDERLEPLMRDEAMDLDPCFGPDGLLYFSTDRGGIYNIWAMDVPTRRTWKITNVVSGAFTPRITPDGRWIYLTTYTPGGYAIARMPHPGLPQGEGGPDGRMQAWRRYPQVDRSEWEEGSYEPWRWMLPLFFQPDLALLSSFTGIGGSVSSYDPVGRHSYVFSATASSSSVDPDWRPAISAAYRWGGWPLDVSVSGAYVEAPRTRGLFAESRQLPYIERQAQGRLGLTYPFGTVEDGLNLSAGYTVDWRAYGQKPEITPEPGDLEPVEPEQGFFNQATLGVQYNYLEQFPYSISPERGISLGVSAAIQDPALGSDYESATLQWNARAYYPIPWLRRHVLTAGAIGAVTRSNFRARSGFSIGGLGPQDVLSSIVFQAPTGGLPVRGFAPFVQSGQRLFWGNIEWRMPIWDFDQGFSTVPLYLRRIKGRVFFDTGAAYNGYLADADPLMSVGAEVQLDAVFGYYLGGGLRLGWAHGFGPQGLDDLYLLWGGGF